MNSIDKQWHELLSSQAREREALEEEQVTIRNEFYQLHKAHFDARPVFDPKQDWRVA